MYFFRNMKAALIFILISYTNHSFGQNIDNTFQKNDGNIYYQGLKEYLEFSEKLNKRIDTLYLEEDYKITDSILTVCGKTTIIKVNAQDLNNIIAKKKSIILYRLYPLKYNNGNFSIDIVPHSMEYNKKRKRYDALYGGGYIVFFKFDGVKFYFNKVEVGGI